MGTDYNQAALEANRTGLQHTSDIGLLTDAQAVYDGNIGAAMAGLTASERVLGTENPIRVQEGDDRLAGRLSVDIIKEVVRREKLDSLFWNGVMHATQEQFDSITPNNKGIFFNQVVRQMQTDMGAASYTADNPLSPSEPIQFTPSSGLLFGAAVAQGYNTATVTNDETLDACAGNDTTQVSVHKCFDHGIAAAKGQILNSEDMAQGNGDTEGLPPALTGGVGKASTSGVLSFR